MAVLLIGGVRQTMTFLIKDHQVSADHVQNLLPQEQPRQPRGVRITSITFNKHWCSMYASPFPRQYSNYMTHSDSSNPPNHPRVEWYYSHVTDGETEVPGG